MRSKKDLATLKDTDIWSLVLFALYKMRSIPEYSSLSELVYILDKPSVLKLCEYYGGMTIKIPTVEELEFLVYVLVLYQKVNIENIEYDTAVKEIGFKSSELRRVKSDYQKVCEVLDKYEFKTRQ